MSPKLTRTIIGAVIAVALAAAVSYGFISQQTADQIQTKANQSLQSDPAQPGSPPQQTQPGPQDPVPEAPTAPKPAPSGATPRP